MNHLIQRDMFKYNLKMPKLKTLLETTASNHYAESWCANKWIGLVTQAYKKCNISDALTCVNASSIMKKKSYVTRKRLLNNGRQGAPNRSSVVIVKV